VRWICLRFHACRAPVASACAGRWTQRGRLAVDCCSHARDSPAEPASAGQWLRDSSPVSRPAPSACTLPYWARQRCSVCSDTWSLAAFAVVAASPARRSTARSMRMNRSGVRRPTMPRTTRPHEPQAPVDTGPVQPEQATSTRASARALGSRRPPPDPLRRASRHGLAGHRSGARSNRGSGMRWSTRRQRDASSGGLRSPQACETFSRAPQTWKSVVSEDPKPPTAFIHAMIDRSVST
jgi:hypothetical protein